MIGQRASPAPVLNTRRLSTAYPVLEVAGKSSTSSTELVSSGAMRDSQLLFIATCYPTYPKETVDEKNTLIGFAALELIV